MVWIFKTDRSVRFDDIFNLVARVNLKTTIFQFLKITAVRHVGSPAYVIRLKVAPNMADPVSLKRKQTVTLYQDVDVKGCQPNR